MEGWVVLSVFIIGAFLFSFAGVVFLLVKTNRQEKSIRALRRLLEETPKAGIVPPFPAESGAGAPPGAPPPEAEEVTAPEEVPAEIGETAELFKPPEEEAALLEFLLPVADTAEGSGESQNPLFDTFSSFIKGGNLWAAGGVILLLAGFGTLIAYLGRRGFFTVEMGISLAAAAGLAMILLGWRFRKKRPAYFLILQGGGFGTLYLAVFAAHKLTPYLGVPLSLVLMSVLVPPSVIMALFQNSQGLAVLGFLGGFAAPLIIGKAAGGSHIFLFTYYTILNAGVLAIGFFRSWKGLNLLGFFFTFAVSLSWTIASYRPELFFGAEPYFLFFILVFTVLGLRFLKDGDYRFRHYSDIILILGTPAAAAALQWKVFSFVEHGHAFIALFFAAFYLVLTKIILKKGNRAAKNYAEGYLAFGALLANIAVPLELSPGISGAIWAAEGALLFFIGLRAEALNREGKKQKGDPRVMAAGIIVHIAAAAAFIRNSFPKDALEDPAPWRSPLFTGFLVIAVSALLMAAAAEKLKPGADKEKKGRLPFCLALWGFFAWFLGWYLELRRVVPESGNAFFILASISAFLFWALAVFFGLGSFVTGMVPASLSAAFTVISVFTGRLAGYYSREPGLIFTHNFLESPRYIGWLLFFAPGLLTVLLCPPKESAREKQKQSPEPALMREARIFILLVTALAVSGATGRFMTMEAGLSVSWTSLAGLFPLFVYLVAFPFFSGTEANGTEAPEKRKPGRKLLFEVLPFTVSGILGLWFVVTLFLPGEPSPLPLYIPVINPLDLLEGLCIASVLFWRIKKARPERTELIVFGDIALFLWLISILARCVHYYGGVPWSGVPGSAAFQFCVFGFWALYGIVHIILGNRLKKRIPWIAGALLVAADIGKLILIDMRDINAIPRILSFFAAGLVLLFIGWAAPLPPPGPNKERDTP